MTTRIGIVAALIAASTAARADQPGAPGATPQSPQDPLAHIEQDKLHLSKQQVSDKFNALDHLLTPPGSGRDAPPDDHGVNDVIQRFTAWPPFRSLQVKPAWGGAQANVVSMYLDIGMAPAGLLRAARVWYCLPRDKAGKLVVDVADPQTVAVFAACHLDMAKLDVAQLDKDLAADKRFDEFFSAVAHDRFALVKRDADALMAAMTAKAASDADFKRLVFDVPDKAGQDWESTYAAHAKEIDDAHALVHKLLADVPGRGTIHDVGCGEASHTVLFKYVQSQSPKTADDVLHVETDSVGYPLLQAAMLCDAYEGRFAAARGEHWILTRQFERLGQRDAIAFAVIEEISARVKANKPTPFKVENLQASPDEFTGAPDFWNGKSALASQDTSLQIDDTTGSAKDKKFDRGVVAAGAKTKDGLEVTFVKETWQVPDYDCVKSRIINWERDGTPIWDFDCKPSKPAFHTETNQHDKTTIGSWYAPSVKKGQLVQVFIITRSADKVMTGFPVAAWSDKKRTKLVLAYGIPLAK